MKIDAKLDPKFKQSPLSRALERSSSDRTTSEGQAGPATEGEDQAGARCEVECLSLKVGWPILVFSGRLVSTDVLQNRRGAGPELRLYAFDLLTLRGEALTQEPFEDGASFCERR